MSIFFVDKKESQVATKLEIVFIFLLFLSILILLYPKDRLKEQVLNEQSNFDLTAIYLKNMLRLEPQNSKLIFALARSVYEQKKYYLAQKLLELLEDTNDSELKLKSIKLNLQIQHILLKENLTPIEQSEIKSKISSLLNKISNDSIKDTKNLIFLYHVAIANGDKTDALNLVEQILNKPDIKKIYWLKNCHYLASELNERDKNFSCLKELILQDDKNSLKWIRALASLAKKDKQIQIKIKKFSKSNRLHDIQKAYLFFSSGEYKNSSKIFLKLFLNSDSKEQKKRFLLLSLEVLIKGDLSKQAAQIAKKYEDQFLDDEKLMQKFLKIYLLASKTNYASELSKKLLKNLESK